MTKIMLIDAAQPEETRVALMDGKRLDNFDIESASKKQLKGNIYLAKVTRVEPSLQAAFVSYGGNRHGFLPFAEIHPDYYRIPVEDRERLIAEQEELSRQIQAEAKAREEREMAEAEAEAARAANPEAFEADDANGAEPDQDPEAGNDNIAFEADANQQLTDNAANQSDEDDSDDEDDQSYSETQDAHAQAEPTLDENGDPVKTESNRRPLRGRNRRRGRGSRDRGRDGAPRGLDRKPDQIVDREASTNDDDDMGMTPLWKRMHRSYKIQEVIKRGQIMLIQVVKEERGNKGAALTSYITMPGRYCVLMPNSPQSGGVSRKVSSHADRRKMRELLDELQVPQGMSVILRTAGVDRAPEEVKRDFDYLMRLWDKVRDTTMQSTAPALIHEEGSLVKRAVRDLFSGDIAEVIVEGAEAANTARDVMSMMMPERAHVIREYKDTVPLFIKYGAEPQIDAIHSNTVTLKSGGSLVINPTEALVSIDINSGRATRERHIEETALKTNLEAADEIARQLRLRDLGGLVVIDFIDMENRRNNASVEKRMRDALAGDRARVQVGRISSFGLLELSRQRLRPSLTETHFHTCPHCRGLGVVRTTEAMALAVLRAIETVGMENRASEVQITIMQDVATFLFNSKRAALTMLESRYGLSIVVKIVHLIESDNGFLLEVTQTNRAERLSAIDAVVDADLSEDDAASTDDDSAQPASNASGFDAQFKQNNNREGGGADARRRGRRGGRNRGRDHNNKDGNALPQSDAEIDDNIGNRKLDDAETFVEGNAVPPVNAREPNAKGPRRPRGGAGRNRQGSDREQQSPPQSSSPSQQQPDVKPTPAPHVAREVPAQTESPRVRDYEVVNEVTGGKKKGWWKKLTG